MVKIDYAAPLHPIFTKPKRIKIVVGGRGSTKSTGIADYVLARISAGELWCCAREYQNSIDESVHRLMLDEIDRIGLQGFTSDNGHIYHQSGGRNFYRGLSRNITSIKSMLTGVDGLWIEEGEGLTESTLRVLTASLRLSAADAERVIAGEDVKMPEIIITMNRGSRQDPVAVKWLARAEEELERCGYYEDESVMVAEINYTDIPESWFLASGLETERLDDYENMARSEYDSKWHGKYYETVENAIIQPEWFDACIDAHKIDRLVNAFKPHGARIAAHDPFDDGKDAGGYALRHGSIIKRVKMKDSGQIDEVCDWATDLANNDAADIFIWDGDGMGTGLKRQVSIAFAGKTTKTHMFKGSLSGVSQDNAKKIYIPTGSDKKKSTYADTFKNNRAQYYIELATRCYNTYRCVVRGEYVDPEEMISFDSEGIDNVNALKSEMCRIPRKPNPNGLLQILSKIEMVALGIKSPNMADSVMMTLATPAIRPDVVIDFKGWG